jgi:hypothetical protein
MTLHHHATTEQIGTGDLMMERVIRGGVETAFLAGLQYVFASVPAVKSLREAVPAWGESGWIDVGRLKYEVQVQESGLRCPQDAFTTSPDLEPNTSDNAGFTDLQGDRLANAANTFTYTLNLSRCLESNGFTFNPGDDRAFSFLAVNPNGPDNAQQGVWFRRE